VVSEAFRWEEEYFLITLLVRMSPQTLQIRRPEEVPRHRGVFVTPHKLHFLNALEPCDANDTGREDRGVEYSNAVLERPRVSNSVCLSLVETGASEERTTLVKD